MIQFHGHHKGMNKDPAGYVNTSTFTSVNDILFFFHVYAFRPQVKGINGDHCKR